MINKDDINNMLEAMGVKRKSSQRWRQGESITTTTTTTIEIPIHRDVRIDLKY